MSNHARTLTPLHKLCLMGYKSPVLLQRHKQMPEYAPPSELRESNWNSYIIRSALPSSFPISLCFQFHLQPREPMQLTI